MKFIYYLILLTSFSFTQWFQINHDFITRYYYVSYPDNVEPNTEVPLIINMHGYSSNALSQRYYSEMDQFAHALNIAVVYPEAALNNSGITAWNVGTFWDQSNYDDVGFLERMINQIDSNFDIDLDRVYACGMSNGGYMSYELACELEDKIAAFGSVTGNFMLNTDQSCEFTREIPIAHFHGTSDNVVDYYPPSFDGSLTVFESIDFWNEHNNLNLENIQELNENVEIYKYSNEESITQFLHYKVYGGGHDWFKENWGFHTSSALIDFFLQYKLSDFLNEEIIGDINNDSSINIQDIILLVELILNNLYENQGDINQDGIIDILDVISIMNIILE